MLRRLPVLLILMLLATASPLQAQIDLATDAPKPLTTEESRKLFAVTERFRVELVTTKPHLANPTTMAFRPPGRQ